MREVEGLWGAKLIFGPYRNYPNDGRQAAKNLQIEDDLKNGHIVGFDLVGDDAEEPLTKHMDMIEGKESLILQAGETIKYSHNDSLVSEISHFMTVAQLHNCTKNKTLNLSRLSLLNLYNNYFI